MYEIFFLTTKTKTQLESYIRTRGDIKEKLERLKQNPRKANGAHPLHGKLKGKWACWLGSNLRIIYIIDEIQKEISIEAVGTHKIY
ncbi:MAG: type II toxin-antitoxin system mRNA interferase toxin, RelE/StbE family [Nanoarchaeota archaeon]